MKKETWVLLSVASVLLIFGAVRAVRSPAVSAGAQSGTPNAMHRVWEPSPAVCEGRAPSNGNQTSAGANDINAANELHRRQLETAREAQRMRQQEAANELQQRQQEGAPQRGIMRWGPQATRPLS
jgi:hypothetical protein